RLIVRTDSGRPSRTNSAIAEGTVLINVTCPAAGRARSCSAFSARMMVPPQLSGKNNSKTERSKQIEVAANTLGQVFAAKLLRAHSRKATALRCSMTTPLGRPVDPDV